MPLYEYECTKCGHRFESIQKFSDDLKTECPKCKGLLRKLPSAPAIRFKGSGWYVTDYGGKKGGGSESGSGDEKKSDSKGDSKGESKGDSKKDAKKESKPKKD